MSQKRTGNTATYLLTKQTDQLPDINRVKIVIVGVDVAVTTAILFKVNKR